MRLVPALITAVVGEDIGVTRGDMVAVKADMEEVKGNMAPVAAEEGVIDKKDWRSLIF